MQISIEKTSREWGEGGKSNSLAIPAAYNFAACCSFCLHLVHEKLSGKKTTCSPG